MPLDLYRVRSGSTPDQRCGGPLALWLRAVSESLGYVVESARDLTRSWRAWGA